MAPVDYPGPSSEKIDNPDWWPVKAEKTAEEIVDLGGALGDVAGFVEDLIGVDIFHLAASAVIGDWKALQEQAVLFRDAESGFSYIAANMQQGRYGIQDQWIGRAADAAKDWLDKYHEACLDLSGYCGAAGDAIEGLARAAYHLMQDLKHGLGALVDILLLIYTKGAVMAAKTGKDIVGFILDVIDALVEGKKLFKLFGGDFKQLGALLAAAIDQTGLIRTTISALLALAHQLELGRGIGDAVGATRPHRRNPQLAVHLRPSARGLWTRGSGMTLIDPADNVNWPTARHNMLRLLAASGTGAGADFAKDILAGARQPHELLSYRPVTDELAAQGAAFRQLLDKIPPADLQELHADAQDAVRREVDELASLDIEAAEAELRAASEPTRESRPDAPRDEDDDDWFDRSYLEDV